MRILTAGLFAALFFFSACKQDTKQPEQNSQTTSSPFDTSKTYMPKFQQNPWKDDACVLLPDAQFVKIFGVANPEKEVNRKTKPGGGFCIWTWMKPDWKERESSNDKKGAVYQEFKNTLAMTVVSYGTESMAASQYNSITTEQKDNYMEKFAGIGEGAVWSSADNTMMVKKGSYILTLTVEISDNGVENLNKAKEVAAAALQNM